MAIADYAFLSDCQTGALVGRDGSIDWYSPTRLDGPAVFARLLDPGGGHFRIASAGEATASRRYLGDSLVLRTELEADGGRVALTDALVFEPGSRVHDIGRDVPHLLVRRVEGLAGAVPMTLELRPRMEYGLVAPAVRLVDGGADLVAGPDTLAFRAPLRLEAGDGGVTSRFEVREGDRITCSLAWAPTFGARPRLPEDHDAAIEDTVEGWTSWLDAHSGYEGRYRDAVRRSALVLQGLTYRPTGAVAAAATTSLPERLDGGANWDYRFAWLRDLSLVMRALWVAACPDEAADFLRLLRVAMGDLAEDHVQIVVGLDGRRDLQERTLDHLAGYRGVGPVRVGNAAWRQRQLDVLGEVVDAAHLLRDQLGTFPDEAAELVRAFADRAAATWREPDSGMWEARDRERQYVSSKVMRWVALDRAIDLADRVGDDDVSRWTEARDSLRAEILGRGWSERVGAYSGAYGSDHLDASVLLMPLVGFLPADDPRMAATIRAIERELGAGPHVRRWPDDPNGFFLCGFWLVECLALLGEHDRADARFRALCDQANDVGILAEMADPATGELLGNVPQAFSHVGLVNAAWRLTSVVRAAARGADGANGSGDG